jgi:hypothetical protein
LVHRRLRHPRLGIDDLHCLKVAIDDPRRFPRSRELAAPTRSSNDAVRPTASRSRIGRDSALMISSCDQPRPVAADAGFYSAKNEAAAKAKGVKRVCIPNRSTKSPERKREQKKRWFRNGQKWRTGCEGRISVVKR